MKVRDSKKVWGLSKRNMGIAVLAVLLFVLIVQNFYAYNNHLVRLQQEEFLRLARSATYGIRMQLEEEKLSADEFFDSFVWSEGQEKMCESRMEQYLEMNLETRGQILLVEKDGTIKVDVRNHGQESVFSGAVFSESQAFGEDTVLGKAFKIGEHEYAVPVIKPLKDQENHYLIILINMKEIQRYLNTIIADKQDRGYVALKTQDGYIISHKNPEQIGLHMVEGRKKKYPNLDLSYLDELAKRQLSGQEDTYVYDSYWFSEEPVKKGKKVATFTPLYLDQEMWVVTLNLDYQTYLHPMQAYMYKGITFTGGIMLLFGYMLYWLNKSKAEKEQALRENRLLQELNRERELKIHAGKLSQIGTMTGKIAHDFRNFLMPIIGRSEFLLEDETLTEQAREDVSVILEYAEKASELTRQISRLSRREVLGTDYGYFDLVEMVRTWISQFSATLPKEAVFQDKIPQMHAWVYGNPIQIQEVLWNLCNNAKDALGGKVGTISFHVMVRDRKELTEIEDKQRLSPYEKSFVEISISDTGAGIPSHQISNIFEPFFTTKPEGKGTGLGLSIAYDIVTMHGGDIRALSQEGVGSCFKIYLPFKETL